MKRTKLSELKGNSPLSQQEFDFVAGELLKISMTQLIVDFPTLSLTQTQLIQFKKIEKALLSGTPPQYIFKKAWLDDLEFFVNQSVLIPRPETELLIEEAKNFLKNKQDGTVLDIGTGSGCIAVSIKKSFPKAFVCGCDISPTALAVAKKNASKHELKINFLNSDLFSNIHTRFDLICANLPYIAENDDDLENLHDPRLALVGGLDGFELIEKTIQDLGSHLEKTGLAVFEIGYNQAKRIKDCAKRNGFRVTIIKDLNQLPRIAILQFA